MSRIVAISIMRHATRAEIRKRIVDYQRDLLSCKKDLTDIRHGKITNGNPPYMPSATKILRTECLRQIRYFVPALKELYWVLGDPIPDDIAELMATAEDLCL